MVKVPCHHNVKTSNQKVPHETVEDSRTLVRVSNRKFSNFWNGKIAPAKIGSGNKRERCVFKMSGGLSCNDSKGYRKDERGIKVKHIS